MPSNGMYVCLDCRVGGKGLMPLCLRDSHKTLYFGTKITVPKKSNTRAWKRIANGELKWDRRKVRRNPPNGAYIKSSWMKPKKKGGKRVYNPVTRNNSNQPIEVDLGE